MAAFARIHFLMFLLGLIYGAAFAEQCDRPRQLPVRGMMLQRHIYDKRKARSGYAECLFVCREMFACQSFNFVISNSTCEFNNSSKEASPDDFVADPDRYYMKLDVSLSRASLNESSILSGSYLDQLISYLNPVVQTRSRFVRCWRAQTDGWAVSTFHSNCDEKGPTVTIIKVGSYIFGGYTDVSWSSVSCDYRSSTKAFIFSLSNIGDYPVKLEVNPGHVGYATYTCSTHGPTFGTGRDIYISDNGASNQQSYTNCGNSYPLPPGYSYRPYHPYYPYCTFYAGSNYFTPTDIEVFYEATY